MDNADNASGQSGGRFVVASFLLVALGIAGAWDIWAAYKGYNVEPISTVIQDWSKRWPVLPMLVGILLGHLFWPSYAHR